MSEPMTLEETIAHLQEWVANMGLPHDRDALHWLTTFKAENERLSAAYEGVCRMHAQEVQRAERLTEQVRKLRHFVRVATFATGPDATEAEALLKETESSE